MVSLADISRFLRDNVTEWRSLRLAELLFGHRDAARTAIVVLLMVSAALLIVRSLVGRRPGRNRVAMPAILPVIGQSPLSIVRHAPLLLFLAGCRSSCWRSPIRSPR